LHAWVPLAATLVYVLLFLVIVFNRRWPKQNRLFAVYLLAAIIWTFTTFLLRSSLFLDHKLLLFSISAFASMWWVVQLYHFSRTFINLPAGFGLWFGYASLATFGIMAALGQAPPAVTFSSGNVTPVYGWWFVLYIGHFLILTVIGGFSLAQRLRTLDEPRERNKAGYLLLAISLLAAFGFTGITPLAFAFPLSHIGGLLAGTILAYAIVKHELISVNLVLRRGMVWTGIAIISITVYLTFFSVANRLVGFRMEFAAWTLSSLAEGIIAIAIFQLRHPIKRKIDRLFFRKNFEYREELSNFIRHEIRGVFSLQELSERLLPPLAKVLDCQQAYLLLPAIDSGDFIIEFSEPLEPAAPAMRIWRGSPLLKWLGRENRYLTKDDVEILPEFRGMWQSERESLKNLGIEMLFPFVSRGILIGILALTRKHSGKYSLEDTSLVEQVTGQVAISLEKERLQEELRKRQQELSLINHLVGVMTSSLNIQEVYDTFIAELKQIIPVTFAAVAIIEGDKIHFSALHSEVGSAWHIGEKIKLEGSATEWVVSHRRGLIEPDLSRDRMFFTGKEYLEHGIRSIVYLPLIAKDEGIGCLVIASRKPNAYREEQLHLLERMASQISTSVANAQLYASAEQRARIDGVTGLFNRRHFDESIKREIDRHSRQGSVLSVVLLDLDNFKGYNDLMGHMDGDRLLGRIGNVIKKALKSIDIPFRYGGDEFAILLPNTSAEEAFVAAERVRNKISGGVESGPFLVTASLGIASWPGDGLTPDDIINAADQALYYAKQTGGNRTCKVSQVLPQPTESLEMAPGIEKEILNTIYALAATIEAKDPYTYGHSRKVRGYAVALAEAISLPSEKVTVISHAALLHDIGKIGIIDGVLHKADKLDRHEWQQIKSHPQLSRIIVGRVPRLTPCLPAILHHHERWDGAGYPDGLKGEAIPLEARILAIADTFDAMTSNRPYRVALSVKEAVNELSRCAGGQFDPRLVEAFMPIALAAKPEQIKV